MATFQGDSTDEEIGVNLQLAERLSINKGDHVSSSNRILSKKEQKLLCNQRKKKLYRDEQSSSSSSLEMQNDPSSSRMPNSYGLHNKKRQNGDKNIESLANPKRTCLSDRFGGSPERKEHKTKTSNGDVKHLSRAANFPPQPLNLSKRNIFPDNTYEDHLNKFSDGDDSDFEPWRHFGRKKNQDDGEASRIAKRQGASNSSVQPVQENHVSTRHGVQFIDSTSDDDSRTVRQNGALKGGRQSPDPMSFKKVLGRKVKKVIESDDTDDDDWQVNYRSHRLVFSSSDSEDSGPSNKINKKTVDSALKKSANLSFSSGDSFNSNHDHRYHKPESPFFETYRVDSPSFLVQPTEPTTSSYRGRNPIGKSYKTRSSNRPIGQPFLEMPFQNFDSYLPDAGASGGLPRNSDIPHMRNIPYHDPSNLSKGPHYINVPQERIYQADFIDSVRGACSNRPSHPPYRGFSPIPNNTHSLQNREVHPVNGEGSSFRTSGATVPVVRRHRRTHSSKSAKGRSVTGACSQKGKSNLAARYPDLFDAEDSSEVEFFTANSYSDTESNTESLTGLRRANVLRNPPVHIQEVNTDSINVGSSEDEISVVFTSVPQPARNSEPRRGTSRTLGRRYNRGSRRHISNSQDVVSLSPDPVEQVRQMEEDERFARMLQAQFDAEADPTYAPPVRQSPDPCQMTMREPSSSDEESIDLEVFPRGPAGFLAVSHPFSIIPTTVVSRRGTFRTRRPDTRNRRRWASEDSFNLSRLFHSAPLANLFSLEGSDDSYEAFLGLADLTGDVTRGLQKSEINRLPTRKYTTPTGASTSNGAELPHKRAELNRECQVCLSDYANGDVLRILPCFHEFHTPCIDPWLKINHTCPVCRVIVDLGEYE